MSKERGIWYEPHPVTLERKAELVGLGYKIIDAKFKPAAAAAAAVEKPAEAPKRGRKGGHHAD